MPPRLKWLALLCSLLVVSVVSAADVPSLGTAQSDYAAGDYRGSLQELAKLLQTNAAKPGTKTRYDALVLRGECLLHLKMPQPAQQAFLGASRVVRQDANLTDSAVAEGMALLIQKSPGLTYKPKNGGEPIDIVDPESRKVALAALYADMLAANQAGIDKAMKDTSLKPMHDLLPVVTDLYAVEVAATGNATKTEDMAKAMGQHARDLINAELGRLSARIETLEDLADEPSYSGTGRNAQYSRRGLTSIEQQECKDDADYLGKIREVTQRGRRMNRQLGGTGEIWDPLTAEATDLQDRALRAYERK